MSVSSTSAHQGVVIRKTTGLYTVYCHDREFACSLSNRLHKVLLYPTADPSSLHARVVGVRDIQQIDPVAVGDDVSFVSSGENQGQIQEVLPRRSQLVRREATGPFARHAREQVIVANIDQVLAVMSAAQPEPNWNLLDRYLVSAESSGLQAQVILTKMDLVEDLAELEAAVDLYRQLGYPVLMTSSATGQGLHELHDTLTGKISVLVGKSGVGKSSLLNALEPGLGLRISAVNDTTGKGRHTTTNLAMFPLAGGGWLTDTPGMREFGLWQTEGDDLALCFPEMRTLVGTCKFGLDCTHTHEPGCAIQAAVACGKIVQRRYESMLKLREG